MTKNANKEASEQQKSRWFRIVQFLFIVVLAVAFYLLALSMVHHRFHRGGWYNQNQNPQTIAGTARASDAVPNDAKLRIPWHEDLIRMALSQNVMLRHLPLL